MLKHPVRKIISDSVWKQLQGALSAAKHSQAGVPGEMTDREFLEAVLAPSPAHRQPVAGFTSRAGLLARGLHAVSALGSAWRLAAPLAKSASGAFRASARSARGFDHSAGSPPRSGRAKKNGGDQALGRSRGGLSTKIPAATVDENCAVTLHLTPGHAHDGRQFESLYESLDRDNVLEWATLDKGYDADRIRERLAYDGVAAVIPPIPSRSRKLPYDKELYRGRNRIERFFNKLKQFRRRATRYDKLASTFFAAVHLVAAFLIIRNS